MARERSTRWGACSVRLRTPQWRRWWKRLRPWTRTCWTSSSALWRNGGPSVERESLLCVLIIVLGGLALQCSAIWSKGQDRASDSHELERLRWFALWRPVVAAMFVAAGLIGWATSQPDPVPDHVGPLVFVIGAPFALIFLRAAVRASWSLLRPAGGYSIATVGLIRPRVVLAPELAQSLDEQALEAALAHERAHVRNHDPLRIWIGQFAADMQWPWALGERRFAAWLE